MLTSAEKCEFLLNTELEIIDFLTDGQLSAIAAEKPEYKTNFIGSKQKLLLWILQNVPDGTKSIADVFSGSCAVSYMLKEQGYSVVCNDRLKYSFHIAKAIVENDNITLLESEAENLFSEFSKKSEQTNQSKTSEISEKFVKKTFKNIYYAKGVHEIIDNVRVNIDKLKGYKKHIAFFSLGKTCITAKGGFKHFETVKEHDDSADSPKKFKQRFIKNVNTINELVFKGSKKCKANNQDVLKILPEVKTDCAYFDPPYITQFSQHNYERSYHFIEGLMTYWKGKTINQDSKTKIYKELDKGLSKSDSGEFFKNFLSKAKHIPYWMISYRDKSYPSKSEIKNIIEDLGKNTVIKTKKYEYNLNPKNVEASNAKEYLFLCSKNHLSKKAEVLIQNAKNYFEDDFSEFSEFSDISKSTKNIDITGITEIKNMKTENKESLNTNTKNELTSKSEVKNKDMDNSKKTKKELIEETGKLKTELETAKKCILSLQSQQIELKAAIRHTKIKKFMKDLVSLRGYKYPDKEIEDNLFKRCMVLSDEEFDDLRDNYLDANKNQLYKLSNPNHSNNRSIESNSGLKAESLNKNLKTNNKVKRVKKIIKRNSRVLPLNVSDKQASLEEKLKSGMDRIYKARLSLMDSGNIENEFSNDFENRSFMETMGAYISEAIGSPKGLKAFASAAREPIKREIERKYITPLLLTKNLATKHYVPRFQITNKIKTSWVSLYGEAESSDFDIDEEIDVPVRKIHTMPMVNIQSLKNGDMNRIFDVQKQAADAIRKEIDRYTLQLISKEVKDENTIKISGGTLTENALLDAVSVLEDKNLTPKYIVMRGKRFKDLRGWELDAITKHAFVAKGIIKQYGGAQIIATALLPLNEILIIPDEQIGVFLVNHDLTCEPAEDLKRFKKGWLAWMEVGHAVFHNDIISKVIIND